VIALQNVKTTLHQWTLLSALILLLAECGKYSDASPTEPILSDKIIALKDSGVILKLDRSSDIKGPDQNLNGVRDDIDAWIAALLITNIQKDRLDLVLSRGFKRVNRI
jgi:hypothetical protein